MLWACLLFPTLPLDVFARAQSPEQCAQPLVVVTAGHYPRVVTVNAPAFAAGIRGGHLISAALALAPELRMRERDSEAEMRALAQLATWALTFTPGASVASPDAVLAEIGGSLRLFSGLPQLVARLVEGAQALGYAPRLGLAPTPGAALLCARAGHAQPVFAAAHLAEAQLAKTHLAKFLAPVSLQLLDLPDTTRATLGSAGITTFGALAALPRGGLARRFGAELVQMLDRILGRSADPRAPFVPPPHFASRLDLPAPVHEVEALTFGVNRLVQELATWLTARGLGVVRLRLALAHERYVQQRGGVRETCVPFALGAPARTPAHLLGVLRERLARVELPAAVEAITLTSAETAPLPGRNLGLLPSDEAVPGEVPLVDRLRARLGEDAVTLVVPHAEHRPERALREAFPGHAGARLPSPTPRRGRGVGGKAATDALLPDFSVPDAPRPVWLLAEAQPLAHLLEREPWILKDGPERIESGWWDGADVRRDYFIAENPRGERVWIYCDHRYGTDDGEWFLHGLFA
ncbi:MAG: DNA polymerase Y family protein [Casimicrobiaceae bacterium]